MASPARQRSGACWCVVRTAWGWCGLRRGLHGISRSSLPSGDRSSAELSVAGAFAGESIAEAPADPLLITTAELLVAYFEGEPVIFDLPLEPEGVTAFGARVLTACAEIPWGETRGYGELAAAVGSPGAARAVGQALGRNPVPVIVPCHRVIGADGSLTGFGSGVGVKRRLLGLEGVDLGG
ncbi:MAG: methylated-DNA--[protein]-cysteine S-methyltransferase [Armatimonadota bacterium]